jgi:hypothetical protein
MNQILHLANPHDKLSTFVMYPSLGFISIYQLTLWYPRLGHLSLFSHVGSRIGMDNMSFDDLGRLIGMIEIRMVLHILVHGLRFPMLQCDIFTYSMSSLIHSPYAYLKCEIPLVLT